MQTAASRYVETPPPFGPGAAVDAEIEAARAQEYALIAALTARAPSQGLLDALALLPGDATPLGTAHGALAQAAAATRAEAAERAFFGLFVGVGRGEFLPFASYYRTGFLNERPLAAVRADLARLGLERAEGLHDPEDHIALLAEAMAALARGEGSGALARGEGSGNPDARRFFLRHLEPWAGRFFADLAAARTLPFYRAVGALGVAFIGIESAAFALEGPEGPESGDEHGH